MNVRMSGFRARLIIAVLAISVTAVACSDAIDSTTTSTTAPASTTSTAMPSMATAADLVAVLEAAWTASDPTALTELVPASASEMLTMGRATSVVLVTPSDCVLGPDGTGRCELLAIIDGTGLIYQMNFSQKADGELTIDSVDFGGDAG